MALFTFLFSYPLSSSLLFVMSSSFAVTMSLSFETLTFASLSTFLVSFIALLCTVAFVNCYFRVLFSAISLCCFSSKVLVISSILLLFYYAFAECASALWRRVVIAYFSADTIVISCSSNYTRLASRVNCSARYIYYSSYMFLLLLLLSIPAAIFVLIAGSVLSWSLVCCTFALCSLEN